MSFLRVLVSVGVLAASPVMASEKRCYFQDVAGTCISKDNVEPIHTLKRGTPYAKARASLIKQGYVPVSINRPAEARCSIGRDECVSFPETLSCSGTGRGLCSFRFDKAYAYGTGHYIVQTYGEDALYDGARFMSDNEYAAMR